jgi:predicted small secreted protein
MFEKIPSLKDFIIYVTPGILICYFGLDIFSDYKSSGIKTEEISTNNTLSFIGILLSFVVAFIISQVQIIIFNKIMKEELKELRTINETQKNNLELKNSLIELVKSVFEIDGKDIEKDEYIIFYCLNFIKAKANEESQIFIDRCNNLSSLAVSSVLPITLAIWDLSLKIGYSTSTTFGITIIAIVFLVPIVKKIAINFREEYFQNIFRQFIVLNKATTANTSL